MLQFRRPKVCIYDFYVYVKQTHILCGEFVAAVPWFVFVFPPATHQRAGRACEAGESSDTKRTPEHLRGKRTHLGTRWGGSCWELLLISTFQHLQASIKAKSGHPTGSAAKEKHVNTGKVCRQRLTITAKNSRQPLSVQSWSSQGFSQKPELQGLWSFALTFQRKSTHSMWEYMKGLNLILLSSTFSASFYSTFQVWTVRKTSK